MNSVLWDNVSDVYKFNLKLTKLPLCLLQLEDTYSPIPGYSRVRIDNFVAGSLIVQHTIFFDSDSPITVPDLDEYVTANIHNNGLLGNSALRVLLIPTTQAPGWLENRKI